MTAAPPGTDLEARPAYQQRHEGRIAIVGTAKGLEMDFVRLCGCSHGPPPVMGINRTAKFMRCDFIFSLDRNQAVVWRAMQQENFPRHKFTYHSARPDATKTDEDYPWIDHWWPGAHGSGTSAWAAAKVAYFMGFRDIVLCGAPLEVGLPYCDGTPAPTFENQQNIDNMKLRIQTDEWLHPYVRSMSGWTKEFLGAPDSLPAHPPPN